MPKKFSIILIFALFLMPGITFGAIAITPPDHFVGDGTLSGGTASLIKVNIIDETPGAYYLKAYFYSPSKPSARFGYVWNSTTNLWVGTYQENSEQLQIEVAPGKKWNGMPVKGLWQGEISVKTDIEKSDYVGSGSYLKVKATPVTTGHAIEISMNISIIEPSAVANDTPGKANPEPAPTTPTVPVPYSPPIPPITPVAPSLKTYPKNIFINEVCWMGSTNSGNNEWLELFNNGQSTINLDGWLLKSADEKLKINLKGTIPGLGFFLLERTDDETVPNITADLIYKGSLSNNGEALVLIDNNGAIIDQVICQDGWLAGDNKTKQTMEKASNGWQTSALSGGTPMANNSQGITNNQPTKPSLLPTSTPETAGNKPLPAKKTITPPKEVAYPKNIFINEILPAPEGADEQNEWLEIYNDNNFVVDLTGWQIKDQVGAIKTYTWPANSPIKAKGFLIVSRAQSKIVLQNNGDGLTLVNPQGIIADQITYPASPANQSYNHTSGGWIWSRLLTPGNPNEIDKINTAVQQKIAQKKPATVLATSATPSNFSTPLEALPLTAQINQFSPHTNKLSRIFTFFLGLVIAVTSATVVMFLRKKQKEKF